MQHYYWQWEAQTPKQRIAAIKLLWKTLTQEEQVQLLTIPLEDLRQEARQATQRQHKLIGMSLTGNSPQLGSQSCTPFISFNASACNLMTLLCAFASPLGKNIVLRQMFIEHVPWQPFNVVVVVAKGTRSSGNVSPLQYTRGLSPSACADNHTR